MGSADESLLAAVELLCLITCLFACLLVCLFACLLVCFASLLACCCNDKQNQKEKKYPTNKKTQNQNLLLMSE
jgi:uncharacterized membrane protein YhaH (DUF805 family)